MKNTHHIRHFLPFLILLLSALLVSRSCTSDVDGYGSFAYIDLQDEQRTVNINCNDTSFTRTLSTNRENYINVSSNKGWLSASVSGKTLHIKAQENTTEDERTATVSLRDKNNNCSLTLTVNQASNGISTKTGNTLLQSSAEITEFIKSYNRISGNILLGSTSNSMQNASAAPQSETDKYTISVDGTSYTFYRSGSISNTDLVTLGEHIHEILGGAYIMLNSAINDLSPLFKYSITSWTLVGNQNMTSILALTEEEYIESLTIIHSPYIQDFEEISRMSGLKYLNISKNGINDISFLENLNLETLILGSKQGESNTISDISALYGMTSLRNLDISGLPIPKEQIDRLSSLMPDCNITADNMPNEIPELGTLSFISTPSSISLSCEIINTGSSDITGKGFYFGQDPDNLTAYECTNSDDYSIELTLSDLDSSSYYYAYAYARNELGEASTATSTVYTIGRARFDDNQLDISVIDQSITVTGTMLHPGDPAVVTFGTLLGRSPEVSLDNYTDISEHSFDSIHEPMPHSWTDEFTGESGTVYYVRTYAVVDGIGVTYGGSKKVTTEGTPGNPAIVYLNVTPPAWTDPADAEVTDPTAFYGYYFRDDIVGSGETIYGDLNAETQFEFSFYKGIQDMVFSNLEATAPADGQGLLLWSMSGTTGLTSDLLIYRQEDTDLQENIIINATPDRVSSRISTLSMSYYDETGVKATDLSSVISGIRVIVSGLSSSYTLNADGTGRYSGNGTLTFSTEDISASDEQLLATGLHVLPPSSGAPLSVTIEVTFLDGSTVSRAGAFRALAANCDYNLIVNLYDFSNESGNQFRIDVIENIDKEIEF